MMSAKSALPFEVTCLKVLFCDKLIFSKIIVTKDCFGVEKYFTVPNVSTKFRIH